MHAAPPVRETRPAEGHPDASRTPTPWSRGEVVAVAAASLLTFAAMVVGIGTQSFWYDEAATVSGATRSLGELWRMAGQIDAVHAAYYAIVHGVLELAPPTETVVRMPSAVAVALTVPVVYALGRRLASRPAGVIAALVFVALPRTTWMAVEGRSFAITTLLAALLVLLAVAALDRGRWWRFVLVGLVGVLAVLVFVYVVLLVAALGVAALLAPARRGRRAALLATLVGIGALTLPFAVAVVAQRAQLGGQAEPDVVQVFVLQFFVYDGWIPQAQILGQGGHHLDQDWTPWAAVWFWGALAALAVVAAIRRCRRRERTAGTAGWFAYLLLGLWLVVPPGTIIAISLIGTTVYQPRAFAFTGPALALLAGCVVAAALRGRWRAVGVVLLVLPLLPGYAVARTPYTNLTDWREAADLAAQLYEPGSAIVYLRQETTETTPFAYFAFTPYIPIAYPRQVAGYDDPLRVLTAVEVPWLYDARRSALQAGAEVDADRVVVIRGPEDADTIATARSFEDAGFVRESSTLIRTTSVDVWVR